MVGSGLAVADHRRILPVPISVTVDRNPFMRGGAGVALGTVAGQALAD